MRLLTPLFLVAIYSVLGDLANAQDFDPSTNIGNQIDQNVTQTLQTATGAPIVITHPTPRKGGGMFAVPIIKGVTGPYSGFLTKSSTKLTFTTGAILLQETFNEKNSFTGIGVTDGFATQIGTDISSSYGTDIQPNFSYQHASRDLIGTTTYRADTYAGSVGITQKIFPFIPGQPHAVYNLGKPVTYHDTRSFAEDIFPNCDINLGLNLGVNTSSQSTLKKTSWTDLTQDTYGIAPSLIFDLYLKRPKKEDKFSLIPATISIVPGYTDQMTMANNGTSSSTGLLSLQDRNAYYWVLDSADRNNDIGPFFTRAIIITESNTFLHDTNQEPLTPSQPPFAIKTGPSSALRSATRSTAPTSKSNIPTKPSTTCMKRITSSPVATSNSNSIASSSVILSLSKDQFPSSQTPCLRRSVVAAAVPSGGPFASPSVILSLSKDQFSS
jgi:hypothetical protein